MGLEFIHTKLAQYIPPLPLPVLPSPHPTKERGLESNFNGIFYPSPCIFTHIEDLR